MDGYVNNDKTGRKAMRKIRWGMIGCGKVTEKLNGPGLYKDDYSELIGLFARNQKKAADWSNRHNGCRVFESAKELMECPDIDIVYVATTPDAHMEYAVMCAEHNKHCYLEKPVCLNIEQADIITQAFEKSKTKCYVAHYRRGMERFIKIREAMLSGEIGSPRSVSVIYLAHAKGESRGWDYNPSISGGGRFFEGMVHLVDILDFILGHLSSFKVTAKGKAGIEEHVCCLFEWESGAFGSGIWDFSSPEKCDRIEIHGDKGKITFSYGGNGPETVEGVFGKREIVTAPAEHNGMAHSGLVARELLGIETKTKPCTLEDALRTFKVACAMRDEILMNI